MNDISVVIPTYNGAAYVRDALASVFAQTVRPCEVVVVDDASRDDTLARVQAVAREAPIPVRVLAQARNSGGPARPINIGIEAARGELIAVLDQDDAFTADKLEAQSAALAADPEVALAGGRCCALAPGGALIPLAAPLATLFREGGAPGGGPLPGGEALRAFLFHGQFLFGYPGFMFRKSHWRIKGGVDESLPVASDYDLLCGLCLQGKVVLLPQVSYFRRHHTGNICCNQFKVELDVARVRSRYLAGQKRLLEDQPQATELRSWFLGCAYRARQAGHFRAAWEWHRHIKRLWGWDRSNLLGALKLPLHWLWSRATSRRPVLRPND